MIWSSVTSRSLISSTCSFHSSGFLATAARVPLDENSHTRSCWVAWGEGVVVVDDNAIDYHDKHSERNATMYRTYHTIGSSGDEIVSGWVEANAFLSSSSEGSLQDQRTHLIRCILGEVCLNLAQGGESMCVDERGGGEAEVEEEAKGVSH